MRGTRTLTMAVLLLAPPLFFVLAEISWLFGRHAEAASRPTGDHTTGELGALLVGAVVCPAIAIVLGVRLVRAGHRHIGGAIAVIAPALMLVAWLGRFL